MRQCSGGGSGFVATHESGIRWSVDALLDMMEIAAETAGLPPLERRPAEELRETPAEVVAPVMSVDPVVLAP